MLKQFKSILIWGMLIVGFMACTDNGGEPQTAATLSFLQTDYGGCNRYREGDILPKATFSEDTLNWEICDDTLKIFTGIRYICCAPFVVESEQFGDSLKIMIRDVCGISDEPCYCKCICYYTFQTIFTDYSGDRYHLTVWLYNPRQGQDSLLWQVEIP
ncbi:MAG TPA: hypothetical protein P5268_09915 [Candidatus Marinimicrobia bacterium]|nr:hypothetical protein [Candidatus Neomarinimicrobiota bacterium]HRS52284.1 hypothetical protein [Candidatus Neomarinimicrobiota bacterium]HRU93328.1 hypothetical protein [Candidatus Neomarinimicrobiota bacterium]